MTLPPRTADRRVRLWRRIALVLLASVGLLGVASLLLGVGNMLTPADAWDALTGADDVPLLHRLAVEVRLPRIALGLLAGAAMGTAGALLQALTRNPLASPDLTGVTAGAVAAAVGWLAFAPPLPFIPLLWVRPTAATAGALITAVAVYLLTRRAGGIESTRLLLIGILVGGVLSSVTTLSLLFLGPDVSGVLGWLSGSLAFKSWQDVALAAVYVAPGAILAVAAIPRANVLQLGDDVARALGQRREADRLIVLTSAAILTAGVVAVIGGIGFVGLIGPHLVRRFVGSDLRRLVPASALAGGAMVLCADLLARLFDPRWVLWWLGDDVRASALPTGVYLTLFGVPFLMVLLWRRTP